MAKPSLGVSAPASDKSLVDHIKVKARDMIQRITGGEDSQQLSAGNIVELANLIAERNAIHKEILMDYECQQTALQALRDARKWVQQA